MKNRNHPPKGSRIAVDPIRRLSDIENIKKMLQGRKSRDLLLFTIGVNSGLRSGDILAIKLNQVRHLKPGDRLVIKERKTGKQNILMVNKAIYKAIRDYVKDVQSTSLEEEFLFKSRKGKNQPIKVESLNRMIKEWCRSINLDGNFGAHTLRKTFGYIQRKYYGVGVEVLAKRFNHSNPSTTMKYLGISDQEVDAILMHDI
ncbi:MAG: tyrosine-type recombinase/integrase [Syntrophobacteraceae bacterium]|nr:tyrosine-type recombinase/integrase [Syntrophobacteraceae bacterium]HOV87072.1 tyrosine-type recombinase/integrase [Syntrophobacteraceae bacterium]